MGHAILGRAPIKSNVQDKSLKFMAADTIIENSIENIRIEIKSLPQK